MTDTICAIATPPGRGGIGIVRVSGPGVRALAEEMLGACPPPREATYAAFLDHNAEPIDLGIALFFQGPRSYTGEDVLELQGHGGTIVLDSLLDRVLSLGARMARPGEFTERAFVNERIDLAQAESVADLINSASRQAARSAMRSLVGEFSAAVMAIDAAVLSLRVFIEGAIDFPEEEIDFLSEGDAVARAVDIASLIDDVLERAGQGAVMRSGLDLVIGGAPNVGKSSLLNALAGEDRVIVTDIAGTTRDTVDFDISIDGLPVRVVDTAGIRESADPVEQEGVTRAKAAIDRADGVLWVVDDRHDGPVPETHKETLVVRNKVDLSRNAAGHVDGRTVRVSALTGEGLDVLRAAIKQLAGFHTGEGAFMGRKRHLAALASAKNETQTAIEEIRAGRAELAAEALRAVHDDLGEIVGATTTDDLLGEIFASFCIGK